MISAASQRGAICARCQLKRAASAIHGHSLVAISPAHVPRAFSTTTVTAPSDEQASSRPAPSEQEKTTASERLQAAIEAGSRPRKWEPKTQTSRSRADIRAGALTRIRSHRLRKVKALGVDRLGQPADVIILSEDPRDLKKSRQSSESAATADPKTADPAATRLELISEETDNSLQDVDTNLDQLGAESWEKTAARGGKMPEFKWLRLKKDVVKGFTQPQLANYLRRKRSEGASSGGASRRWRDVKTKFPTTEEEVIQSHSNQYNSKSYMATEIMTSVWNLDFDGSEQLLGEFYLKLPAREMSLSFLGNGNIFQELTKEHGVRFDISKELGLVRFNGNRKACTGAYQGLMAFLENMKTTTIRLPHTLKRLPGNESRRQRLQIEKLMEQLSNRYGIQITEGSNQVTLAWPAQKEGDAILAKRDFFIAIQKNEKENVQDLLTWFPAGKYSAHKYTYTPSNKMAWGVINQGWYRWAGPIKDSDTETAKWSESGPEMFQSLTSPEGNQFGKFSELVKSAISTDEVTKPKKDPLTEVIEASVGRIMCPGWPEPLISKAISKAPTERHGRRRMIMAEFPGMAQFLDNASRLRASPKRQTMMLTPAPSNSPEAKFAPTIVFEIDITGDSHTYSAKALIEDRELDVLLPDNTVDLRFKKKTYYDISRLVDVSSFTEQFWSSRNTLDGTVNFPPMAQLQIPQKLISTLTSLKSSADPISVKTLRAKGNRFFDVEYIVQPGSVTSPVDMTYFSYQGYTLRLKDPVYPEHSIVGTPRAELALEMNSPTSLRKAEEDSEKTLQDFFRASCAMALQIGDKIDASFLGVDTAAAQESNESEPSAEEESINRIFGEPASESSDSLYLKSEIGDDEAKFLQELDPGFEDEIKEEFREDKGGKEDKEDKEE